MSKHTENLFPIVLTIIRIKKFPLILLIAIFLSQKNKAHPMKKPLKVNRYFEFFYSILS